MRAQTVIDTLSIVTCSYSTAKSQPSQPPYIKHLLGGILCYNTVYLLIWEFSVIEPSLKVLHWACDGKLQGTLRLIHGREERDFWSNTLVSICLYIIHFHVPVPDPIFRLDVLEDGRWLSTAIADSSPIATEFNASSRTREDENKLTRELQIPRSCRTASPPPSSIPLKYKRPPSFL